MTLKHWFQKKVLRKKDTVHTNSAPDERMTITPEESSASTTLSSNSSILGPTIWIALAVRDLDVSARFYTVLGFHDHYRTPAGESPALLWLVRDDFSTGIYLLQSDYDVPAPPDQPTLEPRFALSYLLGKLALRRRLWLTAPRSEHVHLGFVTARRAWFSFAAESENEVLVLCKDLLAAGGFRRPETDYEKREGKTLEICDPDGHLWVIASPPRRGAQSSGEGVTCDIG